MSDDTFNEMTDELAALRQENERLRGIIRGSGIDAGSPLMDYLATQDTPNA